MELGQLAFGHGGDGDYIVPRGEGWEEELRRLFDAIDPKRDTSWRDYGAEFKNGVFECLQYDYDSECICGCDDKEHEWSIAHRHSDGCYQTLYHSHMEGFDKFIGHHSPETMFDAVFNNDLVDTTIEQPEDGVLIISSTPRHDTDAEWRRKKYKLRSAEDEKIRRSLCKQFGIAWNNGCGSAVHCTCSHDKEWAEWSAVNDHAERCPVVLPNFWYYPCNFKLDWYKYPLRSATMNQPLTLAEFRKTIDACIASLEKTE